MHAYDDDDWTHPRRLSAGERTLVRRRILERTEAGAAREFGITRTAMVRALAGLNVTPETAQSIRDALGIEARAAIRAALRQESRR